MYLALDVETSYEKGISQYPWVDGAYLSTIAIYTSDGEEKIWVFRHLENKSRISDKAKLDEIQSYINRATRLIFHNAPFDLCWLHHFNINFEDKKIWDTMVVEYLLSAQRETMISLNKLAERRLGDSKLDEVKKLWDMGYNTEEIDLALLKEYNIRDCILTLKICEEQSQEVLDKDLKKLVDLKGEEAKCIVDIQYYGLKIDNVVRKKLLKEYQSKQEKIEEEIFEIAGRKFNLSSPQQLSAILYGGKIGEERSISYLKQLKNGELRERSKKEKVSEEVVGLGFKPLEGTEGSKEGVYSTSKPILLQILKENKSNKNMKRFVELLIDRSESNQMLKTYLVGIEEHIRNGVVHTNLNQCVTSTGRFSSSSPK